MKDDDTQFAAGASSIAATQGSVTVEDPTGATHSRISTSTSGPQRSSPGIDDGGLLPGEMVTLVDDSGQVIASDGPLEMPTTERLLEAYEAMVSARRFNEQAYALVRQGRLAVYPSSYGQEACQVAAALVLGGDDWLFPTYRDTAAVAARGVDPEDVLVLLRGDWHHGYDSIAHKVAPLATPLATQLLHAVGLAHAAVLKGEDTVVLAMCGDGATSEGDFHEALNFAAVFALPVVFFVQNNGFAISVPLARQSAAPSLAHKGIGYGVASHLVDGNDVAALLAVLNTATREARNGRPQLVEAVTYRIQAHTNADDESRYRGAEEVDAWRERDPLLRVERLLRSQGHLDDDGAADAAAKAEATAARMRHALGTEPASDPAELFRHVFNEPTPQLASQAALVADEASRRHVAGEE